MLSIKVLGQSAKKSSAEYRAVADKRAVLVMGKDRITVFVRNGAVSLRIPGYHGEVTLSGKPTHVLKRDKWAILLRSL